VATWQSFLREARRFWEVARAIDAPGYTNQAVSNAVHAVIAANDAFCLFHLGERAAGEAHTEAVAVLRRACRGTRFEPEATRKAHQLADVLQAKSLAQYSGRQLDASAAQRVMKQAERFIDWIVAALPTPEPDETERAD